MCLFCISGHSEHFLFLGEKSWEKNILSPRKTTHPPHNWKNILYLYFMFHAILSTFKFFWKNKYLIGTNGPVKFLPARSDFVVFKCYFLIKEYRLLSTNPRSYTGIYDLPSNMPVKEHKPSVLYWNIQPPIQYASKGPRPAALVLY